MHPPVPMQTAHERASLPPWYREPWPWILMAGPIAVVLAGAVTGWLAVRSYDGLIADDYYKQGLAVNQVLARGREAASRGIEGTLALRAGEGTVELRLRSAAGALPQALRVTLSHPTRSGLDQRIRAMWAAPASAYAGEIEPLAAGRWHVIVEDMQGEWRVRGALNVPGAVETDLRPAR